MTRTESRGDEPTSGAARRETATVPLGDVDPARSRHAGRQSAVALVPGDGGPLAVVGLADGTLVAVAPDGTERWRRSAEGAGSVVTLVSFADGVLVGERGAAGAIRHHDAATGERRWRHESADEVGDPQRDSRFSLPFVASAATASVDDAPRAYVAARRYERSGDEDSPRHFESAVYALGPDGTVAWRYRAQASPIAVDAASAADGDTPGAHVAVAYNRCPEPDRHDAGLVVLDAADGAERLRWDPGDAMADPPGQRRVGDVSLTPDGAVLASHADYRGYALDRQGEVCWRVDLARPVEQSVGDGSDTVYAYPNHVHATARGAVFVTGNTYPEEGRETEARHPREHTAVGVDECGAERWSDPVGGFATGVGTDAGRVAVPAAQHFRDRDAATHALRTFNLADGPSAAVETDGIVTCAATRDGRVVAVEEPVVYHDEGVEHGGYRLRLFGV
jgi:outer membrane protein assembly factor BamB